MRCLVSEEMLSSTDNLLISYNGKLAKWKEEVFDSIGADDISSQLTNNST